MGFSVWFRVYSLGFRVSLRVWGLQFRLTLGFWAYGVGLLPGLVWVSWGVYDV